MPTLLELCEAQAQKEGCTVSEVRTPGRYISSGSTPPIAPPTRRACGPTASAVGGSTCLLHATRCNTAGEPGPPAARYPAADPCSYRPVHTRHGQRRRAAAALGFQTPMDGGARPRRRVRTAAAAHAHADGHVPMDIFRDPTASLAFGGAAAVVGGRAHPPTHPPSLGS